MKMLAAVLQRQLFSLSERMPCLHRVTVSLHTTSSLYGYDISKNLTECFSLLNVPPSCTEDELKVAYLDAAKKYHPDSNSRYADANKFNQVESAYRAVLKKVQENARRAEALKQGVKPEEEEEDKFGIKHTAPQHRQYLEYEGVGRGTPSQRMRQYQQYKVHRAAENVTQHRIERMAAQTENALVLKDKRKARIHKMTNALDRLVEDMILDSMNKGEFDNLPGKGKPLENNYKDNPYVDTTTHNVNKIMIQNGFVPDWVMVEKDIRIGYKDAKTKLEANRRKLGASPIPKSAELWWDRYKAEFREGVTLVNKMIDKYNLTVPHFTMQMAHFNIERTIDRIDRDIGEEFRKIQEEEERERQEKIKEKLTEFASKYAPGEEIEHVEIETENVSDTKTATNDEEVTVNGDSANVKSQGSVKLLKPKRKRLKDMIANARFGF
ncbi:dnaJ homolog subfamily C member 28 [Lingula anatina]|uniref:DnaJ homolog subfamily C member 28 n=1 Tax=Lingula anatina TaxID=7574 RepID=A0A1S3K0S0_LINAN|nr:dnaJ homolog subfamily C member 28 [Lingula anatina]|eukprot:XP_013415964.1 dnaJ homolog subfamily C member 28 [Lingula anatina]